MGIIVANIAVAWPASVATIPSGWTRETALDSRYILGAATGADADLVTDLGNTTHIHTSPAHTPTQDSHTHNIAESRKPSSSGGVISGDYTISSGQHTHPASVSNSKEADNQSVTLTIDATSNDLAYVEVIWIKSNGTPDRLPSGCLAFFVSDTLPSGWSRVHTGKYLKGAAASSDGGGTGGSNTHTHTSPEHTHTQSGHNHATTRSSFSEGTIDVERGDDISVSSDSHNHVLSFSTEVSTNSSVTTILNTISHEPPYLKLNILSASISSLPLDIICIWLGIHAEIPSGWSRHTELDSKWIKGASIGEIGETGGSNIHGHTASDCQPIQNAHTHVITEGLGSLYTYALHIGLTGAATRTHTHTSGSKKGFVPSSTIGTNIATTVTINNITSGAAYPKHRTVIFVKNDSLVPPVHISGYTSYDLGTFDQGDPENHVLPETAAAIARGDRRHMRQEETII